MVRQTPPDIDPDLWINEGELTELPEIPVGEVMFREPSLDPVNPEVINTPNADVLMTLDSPEEIEMRERIHERIQAEIHQEVREEVFQAEERLNAPPVWNEVEDLMMDDGEILEENTRLEKRRREEISWGRRKQRKEDNNCVEKREHSPSILKRTRNP